MPWVVTEGMFFSTTARPPNRLPEPGRINRAVTPPARARSKPGSWGHTECSAQTPAVLGSVSSLPSWRELTSGEG